MQTVVKVNFLVNLIKWAQSCCRNKIVWVSKWFWKMTREIVIAHLKWIQAHKTNTPR